MLKAGRVVLVASVALSLGIQDAGAVASGPTPEAPHALTLTRPFRVPVFAKRRALRAVRIRHNRAPRTPAASRRAAVRLADLPAPDAIGALTTAAPELFSGPLWHPLSDPSIKRVDQFLDDETARIEGTDGRMTLVESSVPLRVLRDGVEQTVDLTVRATDAGFVPAVPLVPLTLPKGANGPAKLGSSALSVTVAGAGAGAAGRMVGDQVVYPNALTDTDLSATAVPEGLESWAFLRSAASPEKLTWHYDAGPGTHLTSTVAQPGALILDGANKTVGAVMPPTAHDATGKDVPVKLSVSGADLTLGIAHRGANLSYPIIVDPTTTVQEQDAGCSDGKTPDQGTCNSDYTRFSDVGGWTQSVYGPYSPLFLPTQQQATTTGVGSFCPDLSVPYASKDALCVLGLPGTNYGSSLSTGYWGYNAHNANEIVYRTSVRLSYHSTYGTGAAVATHLDASNNVQGSYGLAQAPNGPVPPHPDSPLYTFGSGNAVLYDFCAFKVTKGYCQSPEGVATNDSSRTRAAGNRFVAGVQLAGTQPTNANFMTIRAAANYIDDDDDPVISSTRPSLDPNTWYASGTETITQTASDQGTGMFGFGAFLPNGTVYNTVLDSNGKPSSTVCGTRRVPCAKTATWTTPSFSLDALPEGRDVVGMTPYDALTHTSTDARLTQVPVRVDRSGPAVGTISGTLYDERARSDLRGTAVRVPRPALRVSASDPGKGGIATSGVSTIDVAVQNSSGATVRTFADPAPAPACDSCPKTVDVATDFSGLPDGDYTLSVTATDHAGNRSPSTTFAIHLDLLGDILHATALDANGDADQFQGEEYVQAGTHNARRIDDDSILTLTNVSCSQDARGCMQLRTANRSADGSSTDSHTVATATSYDAARLLRQSEMLAAQLNSTGSATATGDEYSLLKSFQRPPAGHGDTYAEYDNLKTETVGGNSLQVGSKLYVDTATHLPLRTEELDDGTVTDADYWTYDADRITTTEAGSNFFSVTSPSSTPEHQTAAPADGSAAAPFPAPATREDMLNESRSFRSMFGLDTNEADIERIVDDPAASAAVDTFGVPLTPAELAEMQLRVTADEAASTIDDYGMSHASTYAGRYWDPTTGILHVGFTQSADDQLAGLKSVFAYPSRLLTFTATRTLADLNATAAQINADVASGSLTVPVTTVAVNEQTNAVDVGSSSPNSTDEALLKSRYGSSTTLSFANPTEVAGANTPAAAGLHIEAMFQNQFGDMQTGSCTAGFTVVAKGSRNGHTYRRFYKLTAGHCQPYFGYEGEGYAAGAGTVWYTNYSDIGETRATIYPGAKQTLPADVSAIRVRAHDQVTSLLYIRDDGTSGHYVKVTGGITPSPGQGSPVCSSGAQERKSYCGVVTDRSIDRPGSRKSTISEQVHVHFAACAVIEGDSGGPAYRSRSQGVVDAVGITGAVDGDQSCPGVPNPDLPGQDVYGGHDGYFTTIANALGQLDKVQGAGASSPFSLFTTEAK